MSQHTEVTDQSYGMGRKTLKAYVTGLGLSLLLSILSFVIVAEHNLSNQAIFVSLGVLAITQFFVQVIYFLRMNFSPESRSSAIAFLFTIVIVFVLAAGSLWIMYNLNYNMMN